MSERIPMRESAERGRNVLLVFEPIRHGIREPVQGRLTDLGREITDERGRERAARSEDFDAVKAIGSTTRYEAHETSRMTARSFETAHRYARAIAGDGAFETRPETRLSYETAKTPTPYDHRKIYNETLAGLLEPLGKSLAEFEQLSKEEQMELSHKAQTATIAAAFETKGKEAEKWKREVAGQLADLVEQYMGVARRLKSGSRVLVPAGTHGGTMEWLLKRALVWKAKDGTEKHGIKTAEEFEELGGAFDSSESYSVVIRTDAQGNLALPLKVKFINPARPQGPMHLDAEKVAELARFFRKLHAEDEEAERQRLGLKKARMYKTLPSER